MSKLAPVTAIVDEGGTLPGGLAIVKITSCSVNYADVTIRWGLYESAICHHARFSIGEAACHKPHDKARRSTRLQRVTAQHGTTYEPKREYWGTDMHACCSEREAPRLSRPDRLQPATSLLAQPDLRGAVNQVTYAGTLCKRTPSY